MKPLGLILVLGFCEIACTTTTTTTTEEEIVTEESQTISADKSKTKEEEEQKAPRSAPLAGESDDAGSGSRVADEDAARCGALSTRDACMKCCDFNSADAAACSATAACESKAAQEADCRTSGCSTGESCNKCWQGWVCVTEGSKC